MSYELSVTVYGAGTNPNARSHWAIMIHQVGQDHGELLNVKLLDLATIRYQFEERASPLEDASCEGRWRVAQLDYKQRLKAKRIVQSVATPTDGKKRCQDWMLDVFIELEAEELIAPGFSQQCSKRIGMSAKDLGASLGDTWVATSSRTTG